MATNHWKYLSIALAIVLVASSLLSIQIVGSLDEQLDSMGGKLNRIDSEYDDLKAKYDMLKDYFGLDYYTSNLVYLQLGFPKITSGGLPYSPSLPNYTVYISGSNIPNFKLGTIPVPVINLKDALKIATSPANLDPTEYCLISADFSDGTVLNNTLEWSPSWSFYFARTYQDFWLYGFGLDYSSGAITVNAFNGSIMRIYGFGENDMYLPTSGENFELKVNMTQALKIVRKSSLNGVPRELTEDGKMQMAEPRIVLFGPDSRYGYLESPLDPLLSGKKKLCWIIQLHSPVPGYGYSGTFAVDAETGEIVVGYAQASYPSLNYPFLSGAIDGSSVCNLKVLQLNFSIDGKIIGMEGKLPLIVPNVVVVRPGASGSIGLNITSNHSQDVIVNLTMANPLPGLQSLGSDSSPEGVSMQFMRQQMVVQANGTSQATLLISVQNDVLQRTYLLEVDLEYMYPQWNQPSKQSFVFLLTIWDGKGYIPPLPIIGNG